MAYSAGTMGGALFGAIVLLFATNSAAAETQVPPAEEENAISLVHTAGEVLVNSGFGFFPAESGRALVPGDRIIFGADASAQIAFPGGCVRELGADPLVTVDEAALCDAEISLVEAGIIRGIQPAQGREEFFRRFGGLPFGFAAALFAVLMGTVFDDDPEPISP